MSLLSEIRSTLRVLPPRVIVHGQRKIGKSTFGSKSPKPIFISTEDGQDALDVDAFPLCETLESVRSCIKELYKEKHDYKTVVLDSLDWLEPLAYAELCAKFKKDSIEDFGYGKGYVFAADKVREVFAALNLLRKERGMNILLIAHTEVKRFDDPQSESYDRYQMKLGRHVAKLVEEWCDILAFAQIRAEIQKEDAGFSKKRTRAESTGERVLRLTPSPAYDAGNRYGLPATLPLEWSALEEAMMHARNNNSRGYTANNEETENDG